MTIFNFSAISFYFNFRKHLSSVWDIGPLDWVWPVDEQGQTCHSSTNIKRYFKSNQVRIKSCQLRQKFRKECKLFKVYANIWKKLHSLHKFVCCFYTKCVKLRVKFIHIVWYCNIMWNIHKRTRPNWARKVREMILFSVLCTVGEVAWA